mgnify:FL=1
MLIQHKAAQAALHLYLNDYHMTVVQARTIAGNELRTSKEINAFLETEKEARHQVSRLSKFYKELFPARHSKPSARNRAIYNRAKQLYMQSDNWQRVKKARIERAGGLCEAQTTGCTGDAEAVHHLSYAHLGDECLWDLRAVCKHCHNKVSRYGKK